MSELKVGDKVRIKKLTEDEFHKLQEKGIDEDMFYSSYLKRNESLYNKIFKIDRINSISKSYHFNDLCLPYYEEEIEKVFDFKQKIKFVKEVIK